MKNTKTNIAIIVLLIISTASVVGDDSVDPFILGAKVHYMVRVKNLRTADEISTYEMFSSTHFTSYVQGWLDMAEYLVPTPEKWIEGSSVSPSSYQEIVDEVSIYIVNNPTEVLNRHSRDIVMKACTNKWPSFASEIVLQSLKAAEKNSK